MTDVPNHVGSNPACMLRHTSVTANVPARLCAYARACTPQYGNACTYACGNSDSSTLAISTACKRMERLGLSLQGGTRSLRDNQIFRESML